MNGTWFKATVLIALTAAGGRAYGDDARAETPARPSTPKVAARLIAETQGLVPGQTAHLGIHLVIEPGWHVYWDGVNDTGQPPHFTAKLPEGYALLPTQWPGPHRHIAPGGILDHIYEDQVTLIVPVRVPADAQPGSQVAIDMELDWLVCKNVCIPESAPVHLTLPVVATDARPARSTEAALFDRTRASLPRPWPANSAPARVAWRGETVVVTSANTGRLEFYPGLESSAIVDPLHTLASQEGRLLIQVEDGASAPPRVAGILAVWPAGEGAPVYYQLDTRPP